MTDPTKTAADLAAAAMSSANFGATVSGWRTRWLSWLAAWKYVLILLAMLGGSLWLNVHQWKRAITAPLRAENADLKAAQVTAAGLIADGQAREFHLIKAMSDVSRLLKGAASDYDAAIALKPLTPSNCAPGQGRVDATNRALGAKRRVK